MGEGRGKLEEKKVHTSSRSVPQSSALVEEGKGRRKATAPGTATRWNEASSLGGRGKKESLWCAEVADLILPPVSSRREKKKKKKKLRFQSREPLEQETSAGEGSYAQGRAGRKNRRVPA